MSGVYRGASGLVKRSCAVWTSVAVLEREIFYQRRPNGLSLYLGLPALDGVMTREGAGVKTRSSYPSRSLHKGPEKVVT